jgi:hypothetical protein
MRKTTKSSLHRYMYNIFEQFKTDVNDVSKFFYIIDGGMILHTSENCTTYLKPRRNNVLLNENKFELVFKYQ